MRFFQQVIILAIVCLSVAACGPKAPTEVDIVLSEWLIDPNDVVVQAGTVTFSVENMGALEHNFVIEGVDEHLELIFQGDTVVLKVDLAPGTYKLLCTLEGHEEAGMAGTLIVEE